ncbi:MAG: DUF4349 domain-containing protein [Acidobacteria bacterium]|nr:DUF4349 domain-containing protein [Acidobacteriota bacterium]
MRRFFALLLLLAALACKKEERAMEPNQIASPPPVPPPPQTEALRAQVATDGADASGAAIAPATVPAAPAIPRMMIRTATITMVVGDTSAVIDKITRAIEANGGYVNDSKIWRDGEQLRATLSLRVPAARLTPSLAAVRQLAVRVQSENVSSTEVTQEYVDLASRLRNLEAAENELRQLLAEVRVKTKRAGDVLEIYQQLVEIRNQIEQTKGRMQYLSQMSALSTINLELIPDAIAKPVVEPGWQPLVIVKDAGRSLVNALKGIATALIWIAIYLLPVVAIFVLAAYGVWKVLRRLMRKPAA